MKKGRAPSLLSVNTGKPARVQVKRQCSCRRCKKNLIKGEVCVDISISGAYASKKRYCMSCFKDIFSKTKQELINIEETIIHNEP